MLEKAGLPYLWIKNIMHCVETVRTSIVWNGKPLKWFRPSRGIRQGDLISPYLFVLFMEQLGHIISQAAEEGKWNPITLSRHGPPISHLFFANDLLLFAEVSEIQMETIMGCLNILCESSGQKINPLKSNVAFSTGVDEEVALRISAFLGMPIITKLEKYLGIPSIMGWTNTKTFQYLQERIEGHLEGWKTKQLTLARRITLDKTILSSTPL